MRDALNGALMRPPGRGAELEYLPQRRDHRSPCGRNRPDYYNHYDGRLPSLPAYREVEERSSDWPAGIGADFGSQYTWGYRDYSASRIAT